MSTIENYLQLWKIIIITIIILLLLLLLLLSLLQVIPVKVNYNYFTLYKASSLNLKIIWSKRVN